MRRSFPERAGCSGRESCERLQRMVLPAVPNKMTLRSDWQENDPCKFADTAFSAELAVRRVVSGEPATAIIFGLTYHLEGNGLTQGETDSF